MGTMGTLTSISTLPSGNLATASGAMMMMRPRTTLKRHGDMMMRNVMSTSVGTWSFSSRATRLRPHDEVITDLLLHELAGHLLADLLVHEEISDLLLHADLGDAAVWQRDGHMAHVAEPDAASNRHADNTCYSRRQRYYMLQHIKQRACSIRLRGAARQGTSWSAPLPGAQPSRGCACRGPRNT